MKDRVGATAATLGFNHDNTNRYLRRRHLDRYREKLLPLFPESYYQRLDYLGFHNKDKGKYSSPRLDQSAVILEHALHVPLVTVTNLNVQPGDRDFVFWLFISSYFPCLSACCAPIGNFISLIALIEHWRVNAATGRFVTEPPSARALNIVGFALGIVGNISLLMNFSGTLAYVATQCVSIGCWFIAASVLLAALLITNANLTGITVVYHRSTGFWLAFWTMIMYYCCCMTLTVNLLGYKLRKYPASFALDKNQRLLMHYTIVFSIWQAVGSVAMKHLIDDLSYGGSIYYCTVSMLTVGLGDIVPQSPGARIFALIFSFIGVIIMGLIVTTISQVVILSAEPSVFWHQIEKERLKLQKKIKHRNRVLSNEESFDLMRQLRQMSKLRQRIITVVSTVSTYVAFWLLGGMAFSICESWDYFQAIYFCFLCLLTIGYGDYAPVSPFGRAFFVVWAIAAVPLMTIIISTIGNLVFTSAQKLDDAFNDFFGGKHSELKQAQEDSLETLLEETAFDHGTLSRSLSSGKLKGIEVSRRLQRRESDVLHDISAKLELLNVVVADMMYHPLKKYTESEWSDIIQQVLDHGCETNAMEGYWLGRDSPLRLPLKEPNFAFLKIYHRICDEVRQAISMQGKEMQALDCVALGEESSVT